MIGLQCLGIYRTYNRGLQYNMFVIPVTIVIGKTQSCLSEMQYEAVNISNIYECIKFLQVSCNLFLCVFVVSIKAF